jgi:DNA-binding MarR family transcriptional regulator
VSKRIEPSDAVDEILRQWKAARPSLNVWPMAIIGRISRLERAIDKQMNAACLKFGIERWGFDVLAALRRAGTRSALKPTELYRALLLTSGAITNRLDRLEELSLIARDGDPNDRRGSRITLTAKGQKLIDEMVEFHMEVEMRMLSQLSGADQKRLANLLRQLSLSVDAIGHT